jgi:hypothetical protein
MNTICCKCGALNSMTKPYGKAMKCTLHKKGECGDTMYKLKCKHCGNKYSDQTFEEQFETITKRN